MKCIRKWKENPTKKDKTKKTYISEKKK
jgi:hypothetical protein